MSLDRTRSASPSRGDQHRVSQTDAKSPGVQRIEAISKALTLRDRICIFLSIFLIAYVYGLDGTLRYTYQPYATASYGQHSLYSSVNVLRAVIAAAAQPTSARIADVFGRVELICASVFFYVVGTAIEAGATNLDTFAGGSVLYQIGFTMILLLVEVVIADITSTRARLLFSYIPALPFIINTWVSGDISEAVLESTDWKWGIGMWTIIYTVCAMPLIISLWVVSRRARRLGYLDDYKSTLQLVGGKNLAVSLFWRLDIIGILFLIAMFALLLVPLTLAGGFESKWGEAYIIAPLVVGILCIPAFIWWESRWAPHPISPFYLMKDRGIWAALGIAVLLNFSWTMQADYLYTVLIVAFDFSIKSATRITSLYSFVSVITGTLLGLVVYKVRRLKIFILIGTALFLVAFGLLIHFRGSSSSPAKSGVIGAQVLLGFAGGLFPYPAQVSLQSGLKHEHLAVMTALYLALYNIGSALGNAVSGAIWTQTLPGSLSDKLQGINSTLAAAAYQNPFLEVAAYPVGTRERDAIVEAYRDTQRLLAITGACLCVGLIGFALCLRNPKLNNEQTLARDLPLEEIEERGPDDIKV